MNAHELGLLVREVPSASLTDLLSDVARHPA
jgi:hypothetical protein